MAETHIISALTKKRAEVSGEIKHYENLLKKSKLNLQSIDQTIHLFDESYDLMEDGEPLKSPHVTLLWILQMELLKVEK